MLGNSSIGYKLDIESIIRRTYREPNFLLEEEDIHFLTGHFDRRHTALIAGHLTVKNRRNGATAASKGIIPIDESVQKLVQPILKFSNAKELVIEAIEKLQQLEQLAASYSDELFVPCEPKSTGTCPGCIYTYTGGSNTEGHESKWLGKISSSWSQYQTIDHVNSVTRNILESRKNTWGELHATLFYKIFSGDKFCVPECRVSIQPRYDEFTTPAFQAHDNYLGYRFMSKIQENFICISQATVKENEHIYSFVEYFELFGRPPENILTNTGDSVPLVGFMELVAVGRILNDADILGTDCNNVGFYWEKDGDCITAARVIKVDCGEAIRYCNMTLVTAENMHNFPAEYLDINLDFSRKHVLIWNNLTDEQQKIFLASLIYCFSLQDSKLFDVLVLEPKYAISTDIPRNDAITTFPTMYDNGVLTVDKPDLGERSLDDLYAWIDFQKILYAGEFQKFSTQKPKSARK